MTQSDDTAIIRAELDLAHAESVEARLSSLLFDHKQSSEPKAILGLEIVIGLAKQAAEDAILAAKSLASYESPPRVIELQRRLHRIGPQLKSLTASAERFSKENSPASSKIGFRKANRMARPPSQVSQTSEPRIFNLKTITVRKIIASILFISSLLLIALLVMNIVLVVRGSVYISTFISTTTGLLSAFALIQFGLWRGLHGDIGPHVAVPSKTSSERIFTVLIEDTLVNIRKYNEQTQVHSALSFSLSLLAVVAAFGVMIYGIYHALSQTSLVTVVTAISGVLTELIAASFFYLYNQTLQKMSEYHRKLVVTQNIALALRLSEDLPRKERAIAQLKLIDRLTNRLYTHLFDAQDSAPTVIDGRNVSPVMPPNAAPPPEPHLEKGKVKSGDIATVPTSEQIPFMKASG